VTVRLSFRIIRIRLFGFEQTIKRRKRFSLVPLPELSNPGVNAFGPSVSGSNKDNLSRRFHFGELRFLHYLY
jgi:hypothetical protein